MRADNNVDAAVFHYVAKSVIMDETNSNTSLVNVFKSHHQSVFGSRMTIDINTVSGFVQEYESRLNQLCKL